MTEIGTQETPLRVAVVGSGPAGCYAAGALLKDKELTVQVDMFDALPTPWGLVRAGVAPDHPNIKAVTRVFEKTAAHPEFRFYGNVRIGEDITTEELRDHYHAIIYSFGAQTDRHMGIPGEDLPGSWAATEFVAWYNGHPDYRDREFDLTCETVAIIGNGNVAMDCARMLALDYDELAVTDVADHALEALKNSNVKNIYILGRRGPAQAAFTNPELLELDELEQSDVLVDPADVVVDEASAKSIEADGEGTARRNVEILTEYSKHTRSDKPKQITLRYLVSPTEIKGDGKVEQIELVRNELYVDDNGSIRPRATDETETLECGMVLRSIGYKGVEMPGVPFDAGKGTIPNVEGRICLDEDKMLVTGEYCSGWIKRGPSGVIGTNKKDGQETAAHLLEDARAGKLLEPGSPSRDAVEALLAERKPDHVTFAGWQAIDERECALGEPQGRPRVKLCTREELLEAASAAPALD